MRLMDILQQYTGSKTIASPDSAHDHFDEVARAAPPDILGQSVADAFRADSAPPFGEMVGQMFRKSDPQQQAGVLNQLLGSIGPGILSALGGGILGKKSAPPPITSSQITPQQASQLTRRRCKRSRRRRNNMTPACSTKLAASTLTIRN
jgi:hypothetical protein